MGLGHKEVGTQWDSPGKQRDWYTMGLAVVHKETSTQWGRYTDRLVLNVTGTQWEIGWYTMGLVR